MCNLHSATACLCNHASCTMHAPQQLLVQRAPLTTRSAHIRVKLRMYTSAAPQRCNARPWHMLPTSRECKLSCLRRLRMRHTESCSYRRLPQASDNSKPSHQWVVPSKNPSQQTTRRQVRRATEHACRHLTQCTSHNKQSTAFRSNATPGSQVVRCTGSACR